MLYLTSGGDTAGPGTLIDAMLRAAGLRNLAVRPGYQAAPLEKLALDPPAALVEGFFDTGLDSTQRWSIGRQALVRRLTRSRTLVSLRAAVLGCPAWFAGDAVEAIADARAAGDRG